MPPTTIREAPPLDSFTSLAEHQSQTPATFFGSKPVLHHHIPNARALIQTDQTSSLPIFTAQEALAQTSDASPHTVETVDVFVSSENLTLFNAVSAVGVSIPYPSISLHAIQRLPDPASSSQEIQGLYMQLELSDPSYEEEEPEVIELTLLPPLSRSDPAEADIQALFTAVSNCSNLHPDPTSQEDEDMEDGDSRIMFEGNVGYEGISGLPGVSRGVTDGGLPPPFPGSGGWITAENVSEFFDEEGNWIGGEEEVEPLGEGAGRVRGRDEVEADGEAQVNGHGADTEDEHKRPRVE